MGKQKEKSATSPRKRRIKTPRSPSDTEKRGLEFGEILVEVVLGLKRLT
jgi:hypothetical protein